MHHETVHCDTATVVYGSSLKTVGYPGPGPERTLSCTYTVAEPLGGGPATGSGAGATAALPPMHCQ